MAANQLTARRRRSGMRMSSMIVSSLPEMLIGRLADQTDRLVFVTHQAADGPRPLPGRRPSHRTPRPAPARGLYWRLRCPRLAFSPARPRWPALTVAGHGPCHRKSQITVRPGLTGDVDASATAPGARHGERGRAPPIAAAPVLSA